jgi:protein-S-isoprenylcysteine O-methyltransferase Ste14
MLLAGSALGFSSAWVMARQGKGTPVPFDAARELVIAGPYRVVRNPMVVGGITQSAGVAVLLGSTSACVLPISGVVLWTRVLRPPEERFLVQRFGEPYERYRRAVPLWRPTWPPYRH